jgi:putative acetyltransferase
MEAARLVIAAENPQQADIQLLLQAHLSFARGVTPPGHMHALVTGGLIVPAVSLFAARRQSELLGIGALKELGTHR